MQKAKRYLQITMRVAFALNAVTKQAGSPIKKLDINVTNMEVGLAVKSRTRIWDSYIATQLRTKDRVLRIREDGTQVRLEGGFLGKRLAGARDT
tara:strand:+ start:102 stop:383 length:282 start_codon:yes stop_codon:yes gene_type:complete